MELLEKLRALIEAMEERNVGPARRRELSVAITNAQTAELWLERSLFARHERGDATNGPDPDQEWPTA